MKRFTLLSILTVFAIGLLQFAPVYAQDATETDEPDRTAMLEMIQQLTAQIEQLQAQLAAQREDFQAFREEVRAGIAEGARGEDVRKIQELLATDPEIYPEQLVTGYFGGLTQGALRRFQERHNLTPTGTIDEETRELLNQYLSESEDGTVRPGLLQTPGIQNAIERGVCERTNGRPPFCPDATSDDDDDDDDYRRPGRPDWAGRDDDDDKDRDRGTKAAARDAIEDAAEEINEAKDDLAEDGDELTAADQEAVEDMIEDAEALLEDAKTAYDAEDYVEAKDLAQEVEEIANKAEDMVDDAADMREDAIDAIEDVRDEIGDVKEEFDANRNMMSGIARDAVEKLLSDAEEFFMDAEAAYDMEDYIEAMDLAEEVEEIANKAEDMVDDAADMRAAAAEGIAEAQDELADVKADLEEYGDMLTDSERDEFEELVAEAEELLEDAETAYDGDDYAESKELAEEAEAFIDEADDLLDDDDDEVLRVCGRDDFVDLLGQIVPDQSNLEDRWEAYHDEDATTRSVRVLGPDDAMTLDYIETRLNVFVDEDDVVERVTCG